MNIESNHTIFRRLARGINAAVMLGGGAIEIFGQTMPSTAALTPNSGRIVNFSARAIVASDSNPLIAGFVVSGAAGKTLLLRAVGPTLENFGVAGALADPTLTVYSNATLVTANDDWASPTDANRLTLALTATNVGAFPLPNGSRDSALLLAFTRSPSAAQTTIAHTAQVAGKAGTSGTALLEIYDADTTDAARVINFSALARVGQGAASLLAGFVIGGDAALPVVIRGSGPALASLGVPGTLPDPQLALFRQGTAAPMLQNDNWGGGALLKAAFGGTGAFAFGDASKDAAIFTALEPGVYTAQLSSVSTATGVGLIEIYDATAIASVPPLIAAQPASITAAAGANASLTVIATSLTPLSYQWRKDGVAINGATADTLLLGNLQAVQTGTYTVTVSNNAGSTTSAPAAVALTAAPAALPPVNTFDLVGFATLGAGTTGGGALLPGDPNYRVLDASVANKAQQLRTWLESTTALVVDVQVEVDLGALNNVSTRPKTNPELVSSGIGVINVRSNKTVFSSTGATIRHGTLNISGQNNVIVRNLRFRGLWEFDEGSQDPPNNSPWGYKIQDWDYIDILNGAHNVWIDHCDFEKAYDGIADTKASADLITFSWCRLGGDTEGAVARQIGYLEKLYQGTIADSRIVFTFYKGLRDGAYASQGIPRQSVQGIIDHEMPHDKCNLVGASDTETASIGYLNMTFHHIYYHGCRQRLPRMRFGNAHVFNLFVDNSIITEGTNMATATTCDAAVFAENNYYLEVADPFPAQSGTSPPGRVAQSGCKWIYQRAEQSFAANTFLQNPATWIWNTGTKNFVWAAAPAPNPRSLPYSYQTDVVDYTKNNLAYVGVIVPASAADQATLAAYLVKTTH